VIYKSLVQVARETNRALSIAKFDYKVFICKNWLGRGDLSKRVKQRLGKGEEKGLLILQDAGRVAAEFV
jgi:hypothetical protein